MPNQRSKHKVHLGGFIHKDLNYILKREARAAGFRENKFGFAALLIAQGLERREKRKPLGGLESVRDMLAGFIRAAKPVKPAK